MGLAVLVLGRLGFALRRLLTEVPRACSDYQDVLGRRELKRIRQLMASDGLPLDCLEEVSPVEDEAEWVCSYDRRMNPEVS